MTEGKRPPVEKAACTETIPDTRHTRQRGEKPQRRHAWGHHLIEYRLELSGIGRWNRIHEPSLVGHGSALVSKSSIST